MVSKIDRQMFSTSILNQLFTNEDLSDFEDLKSSVSFLS